MQSAKLYTDVTTLRSNIIRAVGETQILCRSSSKILGRTLKKVFYEAATGLRHHPRVGWAASGRSFDWYAIYPSRAVASRRLRRFSARRSLPVRPARVAPLTLTLPLPRENENEIHFRYNETELAPNRPTSSSKNNPRRVVLGDGRI